MTAFERDREREKERERDRETEDSSHWYRGNGHIPDLAKNCLDLHHIFRFTPYLLNPRSDTYFRTFPHRVSQSFPPPIGAQDVVSCLISWSLHSWLTYYMIFWMLTHFFWFSIHPIHFLCPLFTQVHILFWNPKLIYQYVSYNYIYREKSGGSEALVV